MSWNESGGGRNRDPWNSGGGGKGPPDLDQVVRDLQRKLRQFFGNSGQGPRSVGEDSGVSPPGGKLGVGVIAGLLVVAWLLTGFYRVDDAERGVVLTFGQYHSTSLPGLHWRLPWPIQTVEHVNVSQIDRFSLQRRMLTEDENIVEIDLAVQFRRTDPVAYLFNVRDPEETLAEVSESAIRQVVGRNVLDFILTEGREEVAARSHQVIQSALNDYGSGLEVTAVNLQEANFPRDVQAAVEDAIMAREDRERLQLAAQTYAFDIVPRARGDAARMLESAEAYRQRVIADAEGESDRFEMLLVEYQQAPEVTRQRLYLDSMQEILSRSSKVILDSQSSGQLLYLPMDRLLEGRQNGRQTVPPIQPIQPPAATPQAGSGATRSDPRTTATGRITR